MKVKDLFKRSSKEKPLEKKELLHTFKMISEHSGDLFSYDNVIFKSDIVRSCIRPKAKAVGKLNAKHIRKAEGESDYKINPDARIRFLLEDPNPLMSGQEFQEKMINRLELNGNAFAWIRRDAEGRAIEIYPVSGKGVDVYTGKRTGEKILTFMLNDGKQLTVPYSDVIHLRKDFGEDEFFGESPQSALLPLMEVVGTYDKGIVHAIKTSAAVRWLLKFHATLKPVDIKKQVEDFMNDYTKIDNKTGAVASDPRYDIEQVKPHNYVPPPEQITGQVERIMNFFNTNVRIVRSQFNEMEWTSYYENEIEPEAIRLSNAFTRRLFTKNERSHGNEIIFESSSLQYASVSTKLRLVQFVDRGMMSPNTVLKIMGMPPVEGGDELIRRLDTAAINDHNDNLEEGDGDGDKNGETK